MVLILGRGVISNALADFFLIDDTELCQVSSRLIAAGQTTELPKFVDTIVFTGFLCRKILNTADAFKYNMILTQKVIELTKAFTPKLLIFFSTVDVYGVDYSSNATRVQVISATTNVCPSDYYSVAKYSAERLLAIELSTLLDCVAILRCPGIFGIPNDNSVIGNWFTQADQSSLIRVNSNPAIGRNFLYWKDIACLCRALIARKPRGTLVAVLGSGETRTISAIGGIVSEVINCAKEDYYEESNRADWIAIDDGNILGEYGLQYTSLQAGVAAFWRDWNRYFLNRTA